MNFLRENIGPILALVVVIGSFILFGFTMFLSVNPVSKEVIGAVMTLDTIVISYFFGSSAGSARKNEMIAIAKKQVKDCDDIARG